MSKTSYYEQLKDPRWQKKRLEIMNRANFKCEECGDSENMLSVHAFRSSIYKNIAKLSVRDLDHMAVALNIDRELENNSENINIEIVKKITNTPLKGITKKNKWRKLIAKSKNPAKFLRQNFDAIEADMQSELANI